MTVKDLLLKSCPSLLRTVFCAVTMALLVRRLLGYTPLSRTSFHPFSVSLVPFLISFISTAGTVQFSGCFHPQSTPHISNLQGSREKLINFKSEWNYVRIPKTKALSPPPIPQRLLRPCVNRLTKLRSRKWIRNRFFFSSPVNFHNFSFILHYLSIK